jgi:hypothetical protein
MTLGSNGRFSLDTSRAEELMILAVLAAFAVVCSETG